MIPPLKHCGTQIIKTERLVLRPFRVEDAKDVFEWAGKPEVTKYLSYDTHKYLQDSVDIVNLWVDSYTNDDEYNWAIEYNGKVIGNISVVDKDDRCFECHLGYQINSDFWNKGITTESAKAVIDYLFEVGYQRITSACDTRNVGSCRVMQKIGMTKEGTMRKYYYQKDGSIGDRDFYSILKEEWIEKNS